MLPRRFALVRHGDYAVDSGMGVVAFGVAFADGHVVTRWCAEHPATSSWDSLEDLLAAHGHDEGTSIQWIDAPTADLVDLAPVTAPGRRARRRAALTDPESAAAKAVAVADSSANGFPWPLDSADGPAAENSAAPSPPQPPGRHRRANQPEQSV
jgi:hypothetical protein